jgi:hypothetical protein
MKSGTCPKKVEDQVKLLCDSHYSIERIAYLQYLSASFWMMDIRQYSHDLIKLEHGVYMAKDLDVHMMNCLHLIAPLDHHLMQASHSLSARGY